MATLNRKKPAEEIAEEIEENINEEDVPDIVSRQVIEWENVPILSTNSTLLDLAISGGRVYEGGIPACILAEVFGPAGSGKSALLAEVGGNAQKQGGDIMYLDPEARLDKEYARIYRIALNKKNYYRPEKVSEIFSMVNEWYEGNEARPLVALTDSLAALTTDLELDTGDKMGMRRAKEFSQGFRVNARMISNILWLCSNQEREGDNGAITPGGKAVPYYASLRIRIKQKRKVEVEKKLQSGVKVSKVIGIESECTITKSTVDDPYRIVPVYIVFGYGIDDIRANLQFLKDMKKTTSYVCPDGKSAVGMEQAINRVEENDLAAELKKETIMIWHEIEELFQANKNRRRDR